MEEEEKGWKKGSIHFPVNFKNIDVVDAIPLKDLDRLLYILVSRDIATASVKYSLILSEKGQLIVLGSQFVDNILEYRTNEFCLSAMLASNDPFYNRPLRYECEYFQNHECGNKQYCKIIVPFDTLRLTDEREHLSTIKYHQNWKLQFELKCSAIVRSQGYVELRFNDESVFLRIEIAKKKSIYFKFGNKKGINDEILTCLDEWQKIEIQNSSGFWHIKIVTGQYKKKYTSIKKIFIGSDLVIPDENQRVEVHAKGSDIYLRSVYYFERLEPFILMLGEAYWFDHGCAFCNFKKVTSSDGFYRQDVKLDIPKAKWDRPRKFLDSSRALLLKDEIYFFGGLGGKMSDGRKIAKLTDCRIRETKYRLKYQYRRSRLSVVSFNREGRTLGMICFSNVIGDKFASFKNCETFDGQKTSVIESTAYDHKAGCLGLFKGNPTAIGNYLGSGDFNKIETPRGITETLTSDGWLRLNDHPRYPAYLSCVSMDEGLMTVGGQRKGF
ncbi:Oidioi.mRNA.OKI2018_I69.PAR.g9559.t1.cds [Oikopleura dioica]|uniref:Oidioi.mRNA.OKI2018_I69.PAR.g9559.t1.cds n=1 Tax=Oikopleura dioica TaxID=34765 RepID=A0ABN7RQH3_OIKDI|nr:Oidioi.mRNA.OKI2018_I69.PAR.g9559.t1.cds [Oikopleura dioica]